MREGCDAWTICHLCDLELGDLKATRGSLQLTQRGRKMLTNYGHNAAFRNYLQGKDQIVCKTITADSNAAVGFVTPCLIADRWLAVSNNTVVMHYDPVDLFSVNKERRHREESLLWREYNLCLKKATK